MSVAANEQPPVVCIMGPTASGKTDAALALRHNASIDLISVDSAMVYRGMDIGTAKPSPALQARAPHALIDIRDPDQAYSAADFAHDARACIRASHQAGRLPVLVGGTMLYYRALLQGLSRLPSADAEWRRAMEAQAAREGWAWMHERLAKIDPVTAERLHPHDAQRIQRALEVHALTGQPLSELQTGPDGEPLIARVVKVCIAPSSRDQLHARIAQRFEQMLDAGLIDEVEMLRDRYALHSDLPSMRAVGYRQAWAFLEGELSAEELSFRGIVATRQLARRQLTWLRREANLTWLASDDVALHDRLREHCADVLN